MNKNRQRRNKFYYEKLRHEKLTQEKLSQEKFKNALKALPIPPIKMIVNSNNPLNCEYQVIDANGNDKLFTAVRNFLPVIGDNFTIDWQDRYDITCPHCQKEMHCKPSLFHKIGQFSLGGGSCPNCHEMMSIEFNPYANRMTTEKLSKNWSSKMASKLPKCTKHPRHKWQWVKNFTAGTLTATSGCFTKKGWYRCECGAEKEGKPQ